MSELIKEAMEIDRKAREEVEAAEARKCNIHELLLERKQKIHDDYMKDVDQKVQEYVKKQDQSLVLLQEENDKQLNEAIAILDKRFADEHDTWVDAIVKNVMQAQD